MKLDKKEADAINFDALDQGLVVQETRVFGETPLKAKKCELVLTKLLYLIYHGAKLSEKDATTVFFAITKSFQSKEPHLRRLTYLVIRELAKTAQDVLIVTSSLTQDMVSTSDHVFRTGSVRALGSIIDSTMLVSLERFFKQAFLDNDRLVACAALSTIHHFTADNVESVKRWSTEIGQYVTAGASKSICQYLALGTLFVTRQHDRVSLVKVVQQVPMNAHALTLVLFLRMYAHMAQMKPSIPGFTLLDLKPYLRIKSKNDMVAVEAARVICELHWLYEKDLVFAVTTLQSFLSSGSCVIRFTSMKILNQLAAKNPAAVSGCNVEIEGLLADPNRTVATLAVTALLKTGTESSVDRLINQMSSFVSEISDEFKSIVVDAVKTLCLKFTAKYATLVEFLGSILRAEGGYEYKRKTVEAICELLSSIPESREIGLVQLCEFIEDCEYPKLTAKIIHLIGSTGPDSKNATEFIRYIYNRLILENTIVRLACVGAFTKFALALPGSRQDIVKILRNKCCVDADDEVRDRALVSLSLIAREAESDGLFTFYDPLALETALLQSKGSLANVPTLSRSSFFKALETKPVSVEPLKLVEAKEEKQAESKIALLPELASLGPLLLSGETRALNDLDSECHLSYIVHVFKRHIVIEFACLNTIARIMMENVSVRADLSSDAHVTVEQTLSVKALKHETPESGFMILACRTEQRPAIAFSCTVSFAFRDFDEALGVCVGPPTFESFKLEPFEITFADYVRPLRAASFADVWSSSRLPVSDTVTLELSSLESIQESVDLLVSTFGGRVFDDSDRILPSATVHTLLLGGELISETGLVPFLVKCRIALVRQCVALEVQVKSADQSTCSTVLSLVQ